MKKYIILLCIISVLPLLSLLTPGLPVTHDGQDHVARIANFYQSLEEGNLIPRWGNNLNWGFGHPVLMFLYPFPSYVASVFHSFGVSFVDSTKLVFGLSFIASVLTMYLFAKEYGHHTGGVVAGIMYGFSPYRFVDLYVRGAIGEHVAFIFLPIILWGMHGICYKEKKLYWSLLCAMGMGALLLSHNAITLMMIPIIFIYGGYLLLNAKNKINFFLYTVFGIALGFSLSAFFWIPAFFEGKYTLRDIVTDKEVLSRFVPFTTFLYSPWNYGGGIEFTKEIGIIQWLVVILSTITAIATKRRKEKIFLFLFAGIFFASLFMMTNQSSFLWQHISILQKFQFPWRLLTVSVFTSSVLAGVIFPVLIPEKRRVYVMGLVIFVLLFTSYPMWRPKAYKQYPESFFTTIYNGTTDTGESSPIWSVRFMEFAPTFPMQIADGIGSVTPLYRSTTKREYTVEAQTPIRLVENTLYFPGWNVFVDDREVPIEFQNPQWRGRMTFDISEGKHTIKIAFTTTKIRVVSEWISFIAIIILLGTVVFIPSTKHIEFVSAKIVKKKHV